MSTNNYLNNKKGKVWFIGAGPGDAELITVKGKSLIEKAGAIIYAGSLVSQAATLWAKKDCEIADSKDMDLEQITNWLIEKAQKHETVIRLQTGDPSLYGTLIEMCQPLDTEGIEVGVIPGITSAMASAAAAVETFTLPEVTQTVIFTRVEGRTPMPSGESLAELAAHRCTICLYLSITLLDKIQNEFKKAGWEDNSPVLIVHKASWDNQKIIRSTLSNLKEDIRREKIVSQSMIIISPTLGARQWSELKKSKLYDKTFTHKYRRGIS